MPIAEEKSEICFTQLKSIWLQFLADWILIFVTASEASRSPMSLDLLVGLLAWVLCSFVFRCVLESHLCSCQIILKRK